MKRKGGGIKKVFSAGPIMDVKEKKSGGTTKKVLAPFLKGSRRKEGTILKGFKKARGRDS